MVLDGLLRSDPKLARCITSCAHCGICFLTHPCNANRRDLRCPFGCRKHHHRELGNRRSVKYSKTRKGRQQKKLHNQRRSRGIAGSEGDQQLDACLLHEHFPPDSDRSVEVPSHPEPPSPGESWDESVSTACSVEDLEEPPLTLPLEGLSLDEASVARSPMLGYLRMVASLIEGRGVGRKELVEALRRSMRQRSLAQRSRTHYVLHFLHQHPP